MSIWFLVPILILVAIVVGYMLVNRAASARIAERHGGDASRAISDERGAAPLVRHDLGAQLVALFGEPRDLLLELRRAALERLDLRLRALELGLELEHPLDPCEVEPELVGHLLDAPQELDVLLRVQARALGRALRLDQAARLVHAQRLGVHLGELGGHGDHEDPAVRRDGDARRAARDHQRAPPAKRRARGSRPLSAFSSSSTAASCSRLSEEGTSMTKR